MKSGIFEGMKHYTSIEQSKKLLELGLNPETSDMCYKTLDVDNAESDDDVVFDLVCRPYSDYLKYVIPLGLNYKAVPCWSIDGLLSLTPNYKKDDFYDGDDPNNYSGFQLIKTIGNKWYCQYLPSLDSVFNQKITEYYDNAFEACYEMVVWLLENGHIKKGE